MNLKKVLPWLGIALLGVGIGTVLGVAVISVQAPQAAPVGVPLPPAPVACVCEIEGPSYEELLAEFIALCTGVDENEQSDPEACVTDTPTPTPTTECACSTESVVESPTPSRTSFPYTPTSTRPVVTSTPQIPSQTPTPKPTATVTPRLPTLTPTVITPSPTVITDTPKPPTETPEPVCYQWIMHMPGTPAEQVYCAESDSSVKTHLRTDRKTHNSDYCLAPINSPECN